LFIAKSKNRKIMDDEMVVVVVVAAVALKKIGMR